jgi:hypothetical protein
MYVEFESALSGPKRMLDPSGRELFASSRTSVKLVGHSDSCPLAPKPVLTSTTATIIARHTILE